MPEDIAIIADAAITDGRGTRPYPTGEIQHVTQLAEIGLAPALPYRSIWILPSSDLAARSRSATFWESRDNWHIATNAQQTGNGLATSASLRRTDGTGWQREVAVLSDLTNRWSIPPQVTSDVLYTALTAYEEQMGSPAQWSPHRVALDLLERLNSSDQRKPWIAPLDAQLATHLPWPNPTAMGFCRMTTKEDTSYQYLHVADKNSAYLAAAQSCMYGVGTPIDVGPTSFDGKTYGLWFVKAKRASSTCDGIRLPSPFNTIVPFFEGWCFTPTVNAALANEWDVTIVQGHAWTERRSILNTWAKHIYATRMQLRDLQEPAGTGKVAEGLVKTSFTSAIGIMGRTFSPGDEDKVRWMHRRDWAGTTIAESYRAHLTRIVRLVNEGHCFLGAQVDSLAFLSNEPEPAQALPGLFDRAKDLGGYKHVCTLAGDDVSSIVDAARQGISGAALFRLINQARRAARKAQV